MIATVNKCRGVSDTYCSTLQVTLDIHLSTFKATQNDDTTETQAIQIILQDHARSKGHYFYIRINLMCLNAIACSQEIGPFCKCNLNEEKKNKMESGDLMSSTGVTN